MATEKKKFFQVQIPIINKEIELLAFNSESLDNRFVKLDLTSDLRGKSLEIRLKVSLKDGKPIAEPVEIYLMGFFIRRMMRKGTDYVEDSFNVKCKNHTLRIKPFMITRKKVSREVRKALRENAKKEIEEYVKGKTFENLILDMINNKFQKDLSMKLKKTYPLGLCEIRFLGINDPKGYIEEKTVEKNEEVEYENIEQAKEEKPLKKSKKKKEE
jgi:ribosomal protein S3AE